MKLQDKILIDHTELKTVLSNYLIQQGVNIVGSTVFNIDAAGNVTVEVDREIINPPAPAAPVVGPFAATGANTPIRGVFSITAEKLQSISVGDFGPYAKYAAAIVEDSTKYAINPLFVLADLANQGVNPAYNNPWGISTDDYPHGPGGAQLGQANGRVKNGPRRFSADEWRIAFDRQFEVVASPTGAYRNCNTIKDWALVDAPPGAENDVHGTNASEGEDVGALYNKLVRALG
jgi:hypothetical protein